MDLSIIIVNFNTKDFLKECLKSIFEALKSSKLSFEVIVVDNNSTDKSVEFINQLTDSRANGFKNKKVKELRNSLMNNSLINNKLTIKLIENRTNLGFAKANNQGVKTSKGEYTLLLNPDTIVPKETLPFMVDFMDKNKDVGTATCRVELPSGELDDACHRGFPTPWNAFCHFLGLGRLFPQSKFFNGYHLGYQNMDEIHEVDACVGAFLLIRRRVGEEVGWLDEDYFWYGEDLDFCFRIKKAGWKIAFVPNVKIIHYKGISSGIKEHTQALSTADERGQKLAQKSRFEAMRVFYQKHYKDKYPLIIRKLVMLGIGILSFFYAHRN